MAPPRALEPSGLILADKPPGPSSFKVVSKLRSATGARSGHAGTLDPFASGLLLVLLGSATRLARYLVGLDKRYLTEIDLRVQTTTGDTEGIRLDEHEPLSPNQLKHRLESLQGEVELKVPSASAIKVAGQRAYRLARQGIAVDMPVRTSTIHSMELVDYSGGIATLDMRVSSGTYVRAIAEALDGHCHALRRLEVGPFSVENADEAVLISPVEALPFLPLRELTEEEAALLQSGRAIEGETDGPIRLVRGGELIAMGQPAEGGGVRPETVMPV